MNKIVNGVANDYEFPQLERITIPTESECYLGIIREYQREVERLNNIINKLEKWLKSEQKRYRNCLSTRATNDTEYSSQYATQCGLVQLDVVLDKLQKLRGKDK